MPLYDQITKLVEEGTLSSELCPTPNYWHWDVLKPEKLPDDLKPEYKSFGEIRWYGGEL
jgi:hypothetical protein